MCTVLYCSKIRIFYFKLNVFLLNESGSNAMMLLLCVVLFSMLQINSFSTF